MWWHVDIIESRSFYNPIMVMWWYDLWDVCITVRWFSPVFLWEVEMYVYETLDLTIFESSISDTLITFQSPWWDWCVDLFLMMSCCDMFWLDHFGSLRSVLFWDTFWLLVEDRSVLWFILRCILVAHWELMHTMIYFEILYGCSMRTNGYYD